MLLQVWKYFILSNMHGEIRDMGNKDKSYELWFLLLIQYNHVILFLKYSDTETLKEVEFRGQQIDDIN